MTRLCASSCAVCGRCRESLAGTKPGPEFSEVSAVVSALDLAARLSFPGNQKSPKAPDIVLLLHPNSPLGQRG